jgi:putative hydrolase of the HAD superfamily
VKPVLVLFDLDGTLVDHDAAEHAAIAGWIDAAGLPTSVDGTPTERLWHDLAEDAFVEHRAGRLTFQGQRRQRVARFLPLVGVDVDGMSDDDLDTQFLHYLHRYEAAWVAYADAVDCLTRLRGKVRVAVLTNGDQDQQQDKVNRTGLADLVESVVASSTLGVAKPHPTAFSLAADRLGVRVGDVVYVGDRLDVDARAAARAGMHGIWLNRYDGGSAPLDVPMIRTLTELTLDE